MRMSAYLTYLTNLTFFLISLSYVMILSFVNCMLTDLVYLKIMYTKKKKKKMVQKQFSIRNWCCTSFSAMSVLQKKKKSLC